MRVLHLDSEKSWRGGQNQICLLMRGLKQRGVSCYLAAPEGSPLVARVAEEFPVLTVPRMRSTSFLLAARIGNYCREHGIDIVDAHSSNAHMVGLLAKKMGLKAPLVVHRRVDYPPGNSFLNVWKYKSTGISRFIAVSRKVSEVLCRYGIPREHVAVVPSAVDAGIYKNLSAATARSRLLQELSLSSDCRIIANVAALSPQKDHETLIRAVARLRNHYKNFCLFVAGEGPLSDAIKKLVDSFDLSSHIRFLGFRSDVRDLLMGSDIMVLSSRDEGLGTVVQDAIYAGCQVVCTDAGGIGEMVRHQESAYMSGVSNITALCDNLLRALKDSDETRASMVRKARDYLEKNFSVGGMVEQNLRVYQNVLGVH